MKEYISIKLEKINKQNIEVLHEKLSETFEIKYDNQTIKISIENYHDLISMLGSLHYHIN